MVPRSDFPPLPAILFPFLPFLPSLSPRTLPTHSPHGPKTQTQTQWKQGIPIEVVPFAYKKILQNLHLIGAPAAQLRMAKAKAGPVVSDNGNFIIDAPFPAELMKDPYTVRPFPRFPLFLSLFFFFLERIS